MQIRSEKTFKDVMIGEIGSGDGENDYQSCHWNYSLPVLKEVWNNRLNRLNDVRLCEVERDTDSD